MFKELARFIFSRDDRTHLAPVEGRRTYCGRRVSAVTCVDRRFAYADTATCKECLSSPEHLAFEREREKQTAAALERFERSREIDLMLAVVPERERADLREKLLLSQARAAEWGRTSPEDVYGSRPSFRRLLDT